MTDRRQLLLCFLLSAASAMAGPAVQAGPAAGSFNAFADEMVSRQQYRMGVTGMEVYSLDRKVTLYARNPEQLFFAGSTAKVPTTGSALEILGPNFRFHTGVYRTGAVKDGKLRGDLVLVGSGDANLSGRQLEKDKLAVAPMDHSMGGFTTRALGDPFAAINVLAKRIKAAGITSVDGRVVPDISLFKEGTREDGLGMMISPLSVNDNIIDVFVSASSDKGPNRLRVSPDVSRYRFLSKVVVTGPDEEPNLKHTEVNLPGGVTQVTIIGHMPSGHGDYLYPYKEADPSNVAADMLTIALKREGVNITNKTNPPLPPTETPRNWPASQRVAEYVSPPLIEDIKVTLKLSQNLHAALLPYVIGAQAGGPTDGADARGFRIAERAMVEAGLDTSGAVQSFGAGFSYFTPRFMTRYLAHLTEQPWAKGFYDALPILGRDGSLVGTLRDSPSAGAVVAKTGTEVSSDLLNARILVAAKALAGYTTTPSGERVAFAIFFNNIPVQGTDDDIEALGAKVGPAVGDPIAEIAAAVHERPIVAP